MINFLKMQGLGNDFILIDLFNEPAMDYQQVAKDWCHRRLGIGADGLVLLSRADNVENDLKMVIYNSDGSEAMMCGNAIRCYAKYAYENNLVDTEEFRIETRSGVMIPRVILKDDLVVGVRVNMGIPALTPGQIPVLFSGKEVIDEEVRFGDAMYRINAISMGNPHCVIFVDELERFPVEQVGPIVENDEIFPDRVNVEFIKVMSRNQIKLRVWERGAGMTMACGTGACAAVVACVKNDLTDSKVTVHLPGGELFIEWAENEMVYMTGPAEYVYTGMIEQPKK